MSQAFQSTEGIILRAIPFRDYDHILSIFTPNAGFIKILYKGYRNKRQVSIPLTKVEIIYREKKGEIFSCHEMTLIEPFSLIRKELLYLEVACDLLYAILTSQCLGKAAPQLYALLCFYLQKIPQTANPWILAASFRLKLLKHDGLIVLPFRCCECQQLLETAAFTREAEGWCVHHQPFGSLAWEHIELQMLYLLATCQSYREISAHDISSGLQHKIATFFDICVKR